MKTFILSCLFITAFSRGMGHPLDDAGIEKTFWLNDFLLESGVTLPKAYIKYVTYGSLNKNKSNAILLPSWYGADYNGYNFLLGKGKSLDTTKYFVIHSELFSNGHSSSPSNTPPPYHGQHFPFTSIRDNVRATFELVTKRLGLIRLKAVVGFSMGAQQAFQWAVSHPEMVQSIVAYCGTAKTYPHGYVRLESAIATIKADSAWKNGDYATPPHKGLQAWALHWASWFLSQQWYKMNLYKQLGFQTVDEFLAARIKAEQTIDANDRIAQAITWGKHDISQTSPFNGNIEKALAAIQCKVLYMPSQTDLYFPISDAEYEKQFIPKVQFVPIASVWGHLAGAGLNPVDNDFLNAQIRAFLSQ